MNRFTAIVLRGFQPCRNMSLHTSQKVCAIADLRKIFSDAVDSVKPHTLFHRDHCLQLLDETLIVRSNGLKTKFDVKNKNIHVIGFGKAVYGMAVEVEHVLKERLTSGIISVPVGSCADQQPLRIIRAYEGADKNLPDVEAFETTKMIVEKCSTMTQDDVLICLISGGGSALLTYPKSPLTVAEKTGLIKNLANRGASIEELNAVRISLSEVKGGRLAQTATNAHQIISLIISDIICDPVDLIASGPTVLAGKDYDALAILDKYQIDDLKIRGDFFYEMFNVRN